MMKSYTSDKLLQFIYGEAFITDVLEIEYALEHNDQINEEYTLLKKAKKMLPQVVFSPKKESINRILQYSSESYCDLPL